MVALSVPSPGLQGGARYDRVMAEMIAKRLQSLERRLERSVQKSVAREAKALDDDDDEPAWLREAGQVLEEGESTPSPGSRSPILFESWCASNARAADPDSLDLFYKAPPSKRSSALWAAAVAIAKRA